MYFSEAAGRKITTGMVSSLQTFGEFAGWNPHWHTIALEGGFDFWDRFVFIPTGASDELQQLWRVRVVEFFVSQKLINTEFAKSLLGWKHSGFSIESGTRIYDDRARESLSQYMKLWMISYRRAHGWTKSPQLSIYKILFSLTYNGWTSPACAMDGKHAGKAWARLLAKVYEIDILQ